jgi:DNA-directed RNA polymerase specialized sigma24 family protein
VDIAERRLPAEAAASVTALYAEHALGLVRLADTSTPLGYLRVSVLNGCRTAQRRLARGRRREQAAGVSAGTVESPEARALLNEEQRAVAAALRRLPERQREALVLRYYLDLRNRRSRSAGALVPAGVLYGADAW